MIACSEQNSQPDRDQLIEDAYETMKMATWDPDLKARYENRRKAQQEYELMIEQQKQEAVKKAVEEAVEKAVEKAVGKAVGKAVEKVVRREHLNKSIELAKLVFKFNHQAEKEMIIQSGVHFWRDNKLDERFGRDLEYIHNNPGKSAAEISEDLGLNEGMDIEETLEDSLLLFSKYIV